MNRKQWENRYEDDLDIAFEDTKKEEYADKQVFLDAIWSQFEASQNDISGVSRVVLIDSHS